MAKKTPARGKTAAKAKASPGSSRLRPATSAKGKVSKKAMTKLMAKLQQQPPPAPQFVAGQPDTAAKSAAFGAHMQKLMDQQG